MRCWRPTTSIGLSKASDCLQPRQSVAAAGAADEDRHVVTDQLAAEVGENRRAFNQACALARSASGDQVRFTSVSIGDNGFPLVGSRITNCRDLRRLA